MLNYLLAKADYAKVIEYIYIEHIHGILYKYYIIMN